MLDVFPEALAKTEMLDLAGAGKWEEVEWLAQIGRIHRPSPSVFDWAEIQASHREPAATAGPGRNPWPRRWQAAVFLDLDKEGTADLTEIDAAFRANSSREAGRILTRYRRRGPTRACCPTAATASG